MIRDTFRVKKRLLDPFWKRKQQAVREYRKSPLSHEEENTAILNHIERVLWALERHDRSRRNVFLKILLAWVVVYSLTTGQMPWIITELWTAASGPFSAEAKRPAK